MNKSIFKKIKPITPSLRKYIALVRPKFWLKKSIKSRLYKISPRSGRNHTGSITIFCKGGGNKRLYRIIDFKRENSQGIVQGLEYDPFRHAFIARVFDPVKKNFYYILAPKNLYTGAWVCSGLGSDIKVGHSMSLQNIPVGMLIHNLSVGEKKKGQYARSAGVYAQLVQKTKAYARIKLSSGEQCLVKLNAKATLGVVSNENFKLIALGKAGRSRWQGCRPSVRGVAMNPVDHPHGGGEGKTSGGRPSVTPWGKPAIGCKTTYAKNSIRYLS